MHADVSRLMVTSEIVQDVPVHGSEPTSNAPQEFLYVNGVGSEPSSPITLSSEGLWLVRNRFADDEPPDVATIPGVNLASVGGSGDVEWSGDWWNRIDARATAIGHRSWASGWPYSDPVRAWSRSRTFRTPSPGRWSLSGLASSTSSRRHVRSSSTTTCDRPSRVGA